MQAERAVLGRPHGPAESPPDERQSVMGIGLGIFLMAVGAILAFAVHTTVAGLDIRVVGAILMAAGFLSVALTMLFFAPRRRSTIVETHAVSSGPVLGTNVVPTNVVSRETRDDVV